MPSASRCGVARLLAQLEEQALLNWITVFSPQWACAADHPCLPACSAPVYWQRAEEIEQSAAGSRDIMSTGSADPLPLGPQRQDVN